MFKTHPTTGVRYGVIAVNSLDSDLSQELFHGSGATDLSYAAAYAEAKAEAEREADSFVEEAETAAAETDHNMCEADREAFIDAHVEAIFLRLGYEDRDDFIEMKLEQFSDMCQIDEPTIEGTYEGVKYQLSTLGGAYLLWVIEGPEGNASRLCSPCVPNAADLDGGFRLDSEVQAYYVWVDGDCSDKTEDIEEARRWEKEFLDEGREAYITNIDNDVVDETFVPTISPADHDNGFPCYCVPRDWLAKEHTTV